MREEWHELSDEMQERFYKATFRNGLRIGASAAITVVGITKLLLPLDYILPTSFLIYLLFLVALRVKKI